MTRRDYWRFAVAILIVAAVVVIAHSPVGSWKFP
jgi:uncharacterized membrane protein YhaH (DUF805 family)